MAAAIASLADDLAAAARCAAAARRRLETRSRSTAWSTITRGRTAVWQVDSMCGICGVVAIEGPLDPALRTCDPADDRRACSIAVRTARASSATRVAALGHRRLAIIDRAGGAAADGERGRHVLDRLQRRDLQPSRAAQPADRPRATASAPHSDTEAILHAYEEFGAGVRRAISKACSRSRSTTRRRPGAVHRARSARQEAALLRACSAACCTSPAKCKALRAQPGVGRRRSTSSALEGYLSLGYFLAPATIYRHVRKLAARPLAAAARRTRRSTRSTGTSSEFDTDRPATRRRSAQRSTTLLRDAVHDRLESEVPLGAFLSGGIDSGLVVSFMAEALGRRLVTTSVGLRRRGAQRARGRRRHRRHASQTQHHAEIVEPRLDEVLDRIVDGFDEPFADSSAIPT